MIRKTTCLLLTFFCIIMLSIQTASAQDVPAGQTAEGEKNDQDKGITADVFGDEGGIFHPFLTVETIFQYHCHYTGSLS